jgi:hypothetical protein
LKILLIGDYSAVHTNLKKGLSTLGHQVILASDGDSYKDLPKDFVITPFKGRFLGKPLNILYFFLNIRKFTGYDVVQFISPFALPYYFYFTGIYHILFRFNKQIVYYACATDPAYLTLKNKFNYFPFDDSNLKEIPDYTRKGKTKIYKYFLEKVHKIIPSFYTYAIGYDGNKKLQKAIPLPGGGDYVSGVKPVEEKIRILFGVTRRGFKGADYILQALDRINKKYEGEVEITIVERLPLAVYANLLGDHDILIDQCKSYGYGMNAIFAMEKGILVLSGSEKIEMDFLGVENSAVVNIDPDVEQIEETLSSLIRNKDQLNLMKQRSLDQAKNFHDPRLVAEKFMDCYLPAI